MSAKWEAEVGDRVRIVSPGCDCPTALDRADRRCWRHSVVGEQAIIVAVLGDDIVRLADIPDVWFVDELELLEAASVTA